MVGYTQCNSHSGNAVPHLPFKEALALLTGAAEDDQDRKSLSVENSSRLGKFAGQATEALVELGPDWIGVFLPITGLMTKAGAFLAKKAGWVKKLDQAE